MFQVVANFEFAHTEERKTAQKGCPILRRLFVFPRRISTVIQFSLRNKGQIRFRGLVMVSRLHEEVKRAHYAPDRTAPT